MNKEETLTLPYPMGLAAWPDATETRNSNKYEGQKHIICK